jgi:hypothetical protein
VILSPYISCGAKDHVTEIPATTRWYEVVEMITVALLTSRTRRLTEEGIQKRVERFFRKGKDRTWATSVHDDIENTLLREDMNFDVDFPVLSHASGGEPIYSLKPGHENSTLKRFYNLGRVGYFDIPVTGTSFQSLPHEMRVMIMRRLFILNAEIHVQLDSSGPQTQPPFNYKFAVFGPEDDKSPGGLPQFQHNRIGPIERLFALAVTDWENRGMALQIFYAENKFVLGPFLPISGQTNINMFHLGHWKAAIGQHACSFLHENYSFEESG